MATGSDETPDRVPPSPESAVAALLQEAIAIFTHDLSNPLQSLTVMLELAVEDARDADERSRLERCLTAAEGMRTMLQEFAALARSGHRPRRAATVGETIARAATILSRRFDRLSVRFVTDVTRVAEAPLPARAEWLILGILMAGLAAIRNGNFLEGEMTLLGRWCTGDPTPERLQISFTLSALENPRQTLHVVAFDPHRLDRLRPLADACGTELSPTGDGGVSMTFPVTPPSTSPRHHESS